MAVSSSFLGRNKQLQIRRISLFLVPLNHELQYSKLKSSNP